MYTAPTNAGTYTITAVSNSDSTKSGSALAVVSAPQPVTVSISPGSSSIDEGTQVQFTATVSGVSNSSVTWAVTRGSGTITQSGLYTAPRTAESDTITATSQADSTKSVSASIAVVAPHSVSLNWGASSSTDVSFYKVYRGTVRGGPYGLLTSNLKATTYTDSTVQLGGIYYYVTSAVDTAGVESIFSNEFPSVIPSP
jgi:fibronectin type 3 domain-containing protein